MKTRVVFPFPAVSSKSEWVFSVAVNTVTSKRAFLNPEKVEDKVPNCGWVEVKSPKLKVEFWNYMFILHFGSFWALYFFIFFERKNGYFS